MQHSQPLAAPSKFKPARDVHDAQILPGPPPFVFERKRKSGRKWQGIRYERAAHEEFSRRYPGYVPGPWITFIDGPTGERRYCQPDGLIVEIERGRITVLEYKYRHTELAYWQLFHLYIPVVQALFPSDLWHYAGVEVCNRFDCAIVCPERPLLRKQVLDAHELAFNVHIWRP